MGVYDIRHPQIVQIVFFLIVDLHITDGDSHMVVDVFPFKMVSFYDFP